MRLYSCMRLHHCVCVHVGSHSVCRQLFVVSSWAACLTRGALAPLFLRPCVQWNVTSLVERTCKNCKAAQTSSSNVNLAAWIFMTSPWRRCSGSWIEGIVLCWQSPPRGPSRLGQEQRIERAPVEPCDSPPHRDKATGEEAKGSCNHATHSNRQESGHVAAFCESQSSITYVSTSQNVMHDMTS